MSWLCRIGLHRWHDIGVTIFAMPVSQCQRCGAGREFMGCGYITYSPEQMAEAEARSDALRGNGGGNG
jgi:hypothetical protein